jgi:hypothetical protein
MIYLATIILILLIIIYFWTGSEHFRSMYAPEIYPEPILTFYKSDKPADVDYMVDVYGDASYFVYQRGYPIKQDTFDAYSYDKISNLMRAALKLPESSYCNHSSSDLSQTAIKIKTGKNIYRNINFGNIEQKCTPNSVYIGLRILDRLTMP